MLFQVYSGSKQVSSFQHTKNLSSMHIAYLRHRCKLEDRCGPACSGEGTSLVQLCVMTSPH